MTVLVLADEFDVTTDRVVMTLQDRGVPVFRCDTREFPQRLTLEASLDTEARLTVVGQVIHVAAIYARSAEAAVDWRSDYAALNYGQVELPERVRAGIHTFMNRFGISFGGFDSTVDRDGRWWFLECNSAAQFGWLEAAAGLPISDTLADILARGHQ
jgi:hypothetical protein